MHRKTQPEKISRDDLKVAWYPPDFEHGFSCAAEKIAATN